MKQLLGKRIAVKTLNPGILGTSKHETIEQAKVPCPLQRLLKFECHQEGANLQITIITITHIITKLIQIYT